MTEPIFSKDLQLLQVIPFAVSSSHLNSFFHSGINFLTGLFAGMVVILLLFQHVFFFFVCVFGGACNVLNLQENIFCFHNHQALPY